MKQKEETISLGSSPQSLDLPRLFQSVLDLTLQQLPSTVLQLLTSLYPQASSLTPLALILISPAPLSWHSIDTVQIPKLMLIVTPEQPSFDPIATEKLLVEWKKEEKIMLPPMSKKEFFTLMSHRYQQRRSSTSSHQSSSSTNYLIFLPGSTAFGSLDPFKLLGEPNHPFFLSLEERKNLLSPIENSLLEEHLKTNHSSLFYLTTSGIESKNDLGNLLPSIEPLEIHSSPPQPDNQALIDLLLLGQLRRNSETATQMLSPLEAKRFWDELSLTLPPINKTIHHSLETISYESIEPYLDELAAFRILLNDLLLQFIRSIDSLSPLIPLSLWMDLSTAIGIKNVSDIPSSPLSLKQNPQVALALFALFTHHHLDISQVDGKEISELFQLLNQTKGFPYPMLRSLVLLLQMKAYLGPLHYDKEGRAMPPKWRSSEEAFPNSDYSQLANAYQSTIGLLNLLIRLERL
jgi:hypothetical protein